MKVQIVTQIFNLLYRRIVFRRASNNPALSNNSTCCRLQICDTADYQSALRDLCVLRASVVSCFAAWLARSSVKNAKKPLSHLCPGGLSKIAHRFIGGSTGAKMQSPVGAKENAQTEAILPSLTGLVHPGTSTPPMNRWAIFFRPMGWDSWGRLAANKCRCL